MSQWLKTLTGCLCILTILMHLIPKGKFSSYVRFYGGLLFFLVATGPLWKLFAGEGELERLLQLEFLRTDYYDMESSVAGMAELKNDQIREAYRSELIRQIQAIAIAYGIEANNVQIAFDESGYRMRSVSLNAVAAMDGASSIYGRTQEKDQQEEQENEHFDLAAAAESVRQEIAGVYALNLNQIHIGIGENGQWKNGWIR